MPQAIQAGIVGVDDGKVVDVLGHTYTYKVESDIIFAFATLDPPTTGIPTHLHTDQDEFILVQEGEYRLTLDGVEQIAGPGDLALLPRGVPHSYFNNSDTEPARALFWVNPAGTLRALFDELGAIKEGDDVVAISARHGVQFV